MILFLDIDGVIATVHSYDAHPDRLYPPAVRNVNRLLGSRDFEIVVSSDWRFHYDLHQLRTILGVLEAEVLGVTPHHLTRGQEILQWYHEHQRNDGFIVLDDNVREIAPHMHSRHVVHVDAGLANRGFEERHLAQALRAARLCSAGCGLP